MATIHISGDTIIGADEAESSTKHYTPGPNEATIETPDEVDNSPITDSERQSLDQATESTFQSPLDQGSEIRDRAPEFTIPGEWVNPVIKQRRKQAMTLPSAAALDDLDQRISRMMRFDGMPKHVASLGQKARLAVGAAREAHESARHPENRRYAVSVAAKDTVVQEIAKATAAVGAFEDACDGSMDEWFDGVTANLDKQRADALKALRAAEKAYASLRGSINTAQALALASARWDKEWHTSTVTEADLNAPIASMRAAIGYLESDNDFANGDFLTAEYEGVPPHTLAKLERGADISQPGSFARQVFVRAVKPLPGDKDAIEAIATKHLIRLTNSNPLSEGLILDREVGVTQRGV